MPGIRPFVQADIPRVADLVWQVLHEQQGTAPTSLRSYLDELFLRNPWKDENITSLVYEDSDRNVVGFFGVVPRRMSVKGTSVRLAFGSNFVLDPHSRASMAAMQLVRTFMKGPQDVSITDSANESARQLLHSLGFTVVPIYSLLWARPLRPTLYALHAAARLNKGKSMAAVGTLARPICRVADYLTTTVPLSPLRLARSTATVQALDTDTLIECLTRIPSKQWLLPAYDRDSLDWVIKFVEGRKAFGDLRKVILRDANDKILGWYIYGVKAGAVGDVLQIGAESPAVGRVLDHLFHDAWERKLIGLQGRLEPQFMEELTRRSSFFFRNGSWTLVHTAKPELLAMLCSGTAFFSRLDGEGSLRFGQQ